MGFEELCKLGEVQLADEQYEAAYFTFGEVLCCRYTHTV